jgi:ribonuclease HII
MKPSLYQEKKLFKKGYDLIIGIDEAGRGPLAGPVVACAVAIDFKKLKEKKLFSSIKKEADDSKKLSVKKRERLYKLIKKCPGILYGKGRVSEKIIDKVNILEATKIAMARAVKNLKTKRGKLKIKKECLIIDGNIKINVFSEQKLIIGADKKVLSCALASIMAKVSRDKMMMNYHIKYPFYGFDRHKGYPTKFHRKMIKKNGSSVIHRKTFSLMKSSGKIK